MKWEPAIYEHKAALIGKTPAEVARSDSLLTAAILEEYRIYQADYLTVGLDVYNLEPEALGARITVPAPNACPDVAGPIFALDNLPDPLPRLRIPEAGRFQLLLRAGQAVRQALGDQTRVRVAASGPVTIAAKLAGLDDLLISLLLADGHAERLLDFTTALADQWCACLRDHGLDVILFDSMAAPPMFSPDLYARCILPRHTRLMSRLADTGQAERELVIGGDTVPIAPWLRQTRANVLLCDYAADAPRFKAAFGDDREYTIRRNLNPAALNTPHPPNDLTATFRRDLQQFSHPLAGTGILPYDFNPDHLLRFQARLADRS
ncbi:MAG: hypothetical protein K9N49_09445 [Candidatus Marinimicrobia bacterium]|nr:hypothetical protein [Candidatus Neomarinimicrobiota bacterium]